MSRETHAQGLVLESMLLHRPLPGLDRPIVFPDLLETEDSVPVLLIDDRDRSSLGFPPHVTITSRDDLEAMDIEGRRAFLLEFLKPEQFPGKVGVRVRISLALPDHGSAPLGEVVATFDDRDPLTAVEPTHVIAY